MKIIAIDVIKEGDMADYKVIDADGHVRESITG